MVRHRRLDPSRVLRSIVLVVAIAAVTLGCEGPRAVVTTTPEPSPTPSMAVEPTLPNGVVAPVSRSHPSVGAKVAFQKCQVGGLYSIDLVSGMAQIPSARDAYRYVPMTGREPVLKTDGPAWVIRFHGDLTMRGNEVWIDPVCIVTAEDSGLYGVGPTRLKSSVLVTPEPPPIGPDLVLPTLAP